MSNKKGQPTGELRWLILGIEDGFQRVLQQKWTWTEPFDRFRASDRDVRKVVHTWRDVPVVSK